MKIDFIPIDYDYFDLNGKNYAKIIGRDSKGKRICIIDSCPIYFWAILKENLSQDEIKKLKEKVEKIQLDIKGRKTKVENVVLCKKSFLGKEVKALKIFITNYKDAHDIADNLGFPEIDKRRGYDLGFITHYILEKKLLPLYWYEIQGEVLNNSIEFGGIDNHLDVDMCLKLESLKQINKQEFSPKVLAYDIETDEFKVGEGEILMISLVSSDEKIKKVITWKKSKDKIPNVEYVKDEEALIEKFMEYIKKYSPDFLVGYFSDSFDMPYIRARAEKHKIKLAIGLDGSQPTLSRAGPNMTTSKIDGIVHIDLLKFIRTAYSQYMQSETLSLNDVAKEFIGDTKKEFKFKHSSKINSDEWEKYFEYNLHDSILTIKLFQKMLPDILEFTRAMQEPVFDVSRNSMSKNVEDFIIHKLEKFNEIPEKKPINEDISSRIKREKYEGAFVLEPTPGLYEDIAMFDFTASYGSVIVTYNLSKSTYLGDSPKQIKNIKDTYSIEVAGKKVYFTKKPGFFPVILKEIIEKRKQFKQELKQKPDPIKRARSNAFKLLANAAYGYQGFFGARYYQEEAAAATAAFARKSIKEAIDKINKEGFKTIYSDTDSICFLQNKKTHQDTLKFLRKLNDELPGIMELELEGFFKRGIWVTKRSGDIGAKKKYALLGEDNKLKIRGFETVRRDWCKLAREVQNKIIQMILDEGNEKRALEYVKTIIKKLKNREISIDDLVIKTQLKKPISEYKAISPHVIAAKKMVEKEIPVAAGTLIEFYIAETKEKKKLVREKVKLLDEKGEYDIKYYLERQILPAVENIFQVFNINMQEFIDGNKQKTLEF